MTTLPILHLDQVSKQFDRHSWRPGTASRTSVPKLGVFEVSFALHSGEILGLLGPSGCGKTTLLRLIAGFEQPQSGQIQLADRIVADSTRSIPPEQRSIGMVFQDFALFPHLTVAENIAFGLSGGSTVAAVQSALALIHLESKANAYPHELSGGQQQRVALARAIAPRPKLLLLDEPLSNLDVQVRLRLRQEIRDILKATHTTAVFVTHDQEEALALCDRVAVMQDGQIAQIDTPEQIYREPATRFVAEFVTQANFLPARWQNQAWQTEIGAFVVPASRPAEAADLMIRQEDIQLAADEAGSATVRDRQFLGRDYRYFLHLSGQLLQVRSPLNLAIGTTVRLSVSPQAVRVFLN
ncbi:ABC transporter ATP-binding protein [Microcoleus sp. FACHB-1515]|uniref:ABC transporter ATP-binding protein n=1 Tax=Cyanophyceae TaxID=3028117 RepID=UPI0016867DBA|nr:ABC transporter ATP-binding protein [Microcoleus sp. FACHB-1515]MBD2092710.1 ABC transporter ATP-binding protein [Microcoleus sp. FACHB-1515]